MGSKIRLAIVVILLLVGFPSTIYYLASIEASGEAFGISFLVAFVLIAWMFIEEKSIHMDYLRKHPQEYRRYKELRHRENIAYEEEKARIRARRDYR